MRLMDSCKTQSFFAHIANTLIRLSKLKLHADQSASKVFMGFVIIEVAQGPILLPEASSCYEIINAIFKENESTFSGKWIPGSG